MAVVSDAKEADYKRHRSAVCQPVEHDVPMLTAWARLAGCLPTRFLTQATELIRLQEAVSAAAPVAPVSCKNPRRFIK